MERERERGGRKGRERSERNTGMKGHQRESDEGGDVVSPGIGCPVIESLISLRSPAEELFERGGVLLDLLAPPANTFGSSKSTLRLVAPRNISSRSEVVRND